MDFLAGCHQYYDVIFLDAERSAYVSYWPALKRLLHQQAGALLLVDNVISHREEVRVHSWLWWKLMIRLAQPQLPLVLVY